MQTIEVFQSSRDRCDFCKDSKGQSFDFHVTDDRGVLLRTVQSCAGCLVQIMLKVIALFPIAVFLSNSLMSTWLITAY